MQPGERAGVLPRRRPPSLRPGRRAHGLGRAGIAFLALVSPAGCLAPERAPLEAHQILGSGLRVERLTPRVWLHVSEGPPPGGRPGTNGLLVVTPSEGVLLVDTARSAEQTEALLDWTKDNLGRVRTLVVTQLRADRSGGIREAHAHGVRSFALELTAARALAEGGPAIREPVRSGFSLGTLGVRGEIHYPGPGQTLDNAVVWLEEPRLLFAGCLARAAGAYSLGDVEGADLARWPAALAGLRTRYADARWVVPCQGAPGGVGLLDHTRTLLEIQGRRP